MGIIGKQEGKLRTESKIAGLRKSNVRQLHWSVQNITYGQAHIGSASGLFGRQSIGRAPEANAYLHISYLTSLESFLPMPTHDFSRPTSQIVPTPSASTVLIRQSMKKHALLPFKG